MAPNHPHSPKPGLLINEIAKLFHDRMRKRAEALVFQTGYRQILRFLAHEDGVTQIDIARDCHFAAPTISVSLKKMEKEDLIRRRPDKRDTRCTRVFIVVASQPQLSCKCWRISVTVIGSPVSQRSFITSSSESLIFPAFSNISFSSMYRLQLSSEYRIALQTTVVNPYR